MPDITFDAYISELGGTLQVWEREAATAFLGVVHEYRLGPTGKTFLLEKMIARGELVCFEDKGLRPWQWEAAVRFYSSCLRSKATTEEQVHLVVKLDRFISEHGSNFGL